MSDQGGQRRLPVREMLRHVRLLGEDRGLTLGAVREVIRQVEPVLAFYLPGFESLEFISGKSYLREELHNTFFDPGPELSGRLLTLAATPEQEFLGGGKDHFLGFLRQVDAALLEYMSNVYVLCSLLEETLPEPILFSDEPPRRKAPLSLPLLEAALFPCDHIHRAAVIALSDPGRWEPHGELALCSLQHYGRKRKGEIRIAVGVSRKEAGEALQESGPRLVKAHYALWARYYRDNPRPEARLTLAAGIGQFLKDTGVRQAAKGGYKAERKREAMALLKALAAVEIRASFTPPGKDTAYLLHGPLWSFGLFSERNDLNELLDPGRWEPFAYSYTPGPWHASPEWRAFNRFTGKVGSGLLKLQAHQDSWAILIGGYLGTLMRTNRYAPLRLRVETLLQKTGLAQSEDARQRCTAYRHKLERALGRLQEIGCIEKWQWIGEGDRYQDECPDGEGDWRQNRIEVCFSFKEDMERLQKPRSNVVIIDGGWIY